MMARSLVEMPQRHLNQGRCHLPDFQAFEPLGTTRTVGDPPRPNRESQGIPDCRLWFPWPYSPCPEDLVILVPKLWP